MPKSINEAKRLIKEKIADSTALNREIQNLEQKHEEKEQGEQKQSGALTQAFNGARLNRDSLPKSAAQGMLHLMDLPPECLHPILFLSGNSNSFFVSRQFAKSFYQTMFESYIADPFVRRFVSQSYIENENPNYREAVQNTYDAVMKCAALWEIKEDWSKWGRGNWERHLSSSGLYIHSVARAIVFKEDRNLVLFFEYIREEGNINSFEIPNSELPPNPFEQNPFEQQLLQNQVFPPNPFEENDTTIEEAETIRTWMRENPDTLNRVITISLWLRFLLTIPKEISLFTNLQVLEVSDCGIGFLPPEIGSLRNLKFLCLDFNAITVIPAEIGNLTNLRELSVRENGLSALPPEIGNLINLWLLILVTNGITFLPPEIGQLVNLKFLDLSDNNISVLPPEFINLQRLEYLFLGDIGNFEGAENGQPIDWDNLPIGQTRYRTCCLLQ
ncbi:leucine-rich repeat domain-containing protein [Coxiella burnetii]|uniref:leucine-rich repeat domain-containing protein n=1 Tax=Coxiella burnetii TaxID=777 RepID=UPI00016314F8|nr:leucine-rich repeat domain-containing protein [Coxiella burnetii]ACJ19944.1 leucine-rich repeat protein [Coxiella burnetii CbuK_Q154]EAX32849.2 hypothetical protein A35_03410 [Coxiella burnetii 'MSU Goat Q177']UYK70424.1 leucine-rich repeat domain-containing protein [Coxiella burnetii]